MSLPLAGVRVIECASYVAGPGAGATLARLGADVIRIDPLGGAADRTRWPLAPGGYSRYWAGLNQGKRSVVLDLRSAEGQELLHGLITASGPGGGVLLHNHGDVGWLDDAELRRRRPDLIHLALQGKRNGDPGVDYTANAVTGVPYMTGSTSGADVVNHVLPAWDLVTAELAATALTAALYRRERTGEGAHIRLALEDVALAAVADLGWLADAHHSGQGRPRYGNQVYGSYGDVLTTSDDRRVFVAAMTARQWRALRSATNTEAVFSAISAGLAVDFTKEDERFRYRDLISGVLAAWFGQRTQAEACAALGRARALFAPYQSMAELAVTVNAAVGTDAGPIGVADHPGIGPSLAAGSPWRWSDVGAGRPRPAPLLGADTAQVLTELAGLSGDTVSRLARDGIVSCTGASAPTGALSTLGQR